MFPVQKLRIIPDHILCVFIPIQSFDFFEGFVTDEEKTHPFRNQDDLLRHLTGRALVRRVLQFNGFPVSAFSENRWKKPETKNVFFNISHSGNQVAAAFSADVPIGIDIEKHDEIDWQSCLSVFSSFEKSVLDASPDKQRTFYRLWTRKESLLKAKGIGFLENDAAEIGIFDTTDAFIHEPAVTDGYSAAVCSLLKDLTPSVFHL